MGGMFSLILWDRRLYSRSEVYGFTAKLDSCGGGMELHFGPMLCGRLRRFRNLWIFWEWAEEFKLGNCLFIRPVDLLAFFP
jgi:hypothetical protein